MKLQAAQHGELNLFTAYGEGYVSINGTRYEQNVAVLPDRLIPAWTQSDFATLTVDDFALLAGLDAEIVLLGTGKRLRFPRSELLRPLVLAQKGLEVMDLQAACRTYNILLGVGRKVAVGLLFT